MDISYIMLATLRGWLAVVAVMAFGNTLQCFRNHGFLADRLYTGTPDLVNGLQARLFGMWTLLAAIVRLYCALDITNRSLYYVTMSSFVLALGHFLLETFVYQTATLDIGVITPIIVSGVSLVLMVVGLWHMEPAESYQQHQGRAVDTKVLLEQEMLKARKKRT
ncbi:probable ergosterol biosynthetic protein 28 isoform X1 [Branchiostoma floridae]|uniref:Probable ergosterol biosynthetic protein 28 isoform X1 n=2 Tax=Branchiostoma floridae TaxID=7739 RepID=A0A9J7MQL7_BRAFL|nr:probable ergosterol biosynthetic protein 28 isoform X1 [Branchiostoma floridae]